MFTEFKETLTQEPFPHRDRYTVNILLFSVMHILKRDFNIKHTRKFRLTFSFCLFADAHIHKRYQSYLTGERRMREEGRRKREENFYKFHRLSGELVQGLNFFGRKI